MQMTNEEIVRDYTQAANKSKQIKILAELNAVSPGEIRAVLAQAGVEGVKMPARTVKRKPEDTSSVTAPAADLSIYDRIETILAALPEDASDSIRDTAANLTAALFSAYVEQRLGKGKRHESD